jgi:predicted nucleic acid-binding protein
VRVVLDTKVLVSALLFTGVSSQLVPLWQMGEITVLLFSRDFGRVLAGFQLP